jgi:hypothetical protein
MEILSVLFGVVAFGLFLWFAIWLAILLPHRMAVARNRDGVAWVLVSLLGSPFVAIIGLWLLGEKPA